MFKRPETEYAINQQQQSKDAMSASAATATHRSCNISNQANAMAAAYVQTGLFSDLQRAIRLAEEAAVVTPADHPHAARHLAHLAGHWKDWHDRTGALRDLEKCIQYSRAALARAQDSDLARPVYISNLACCMSIKFGQTAAPEDILAAVSYARDALASTPPGHQLQDDFLGYLALHLSTLASFLNERYKHTSLIDDLQAAILNAEESLAITRATDPSHAARLHTHSIYLAARDQRTAVLGGLKQRTI